MGHASIKLTESRLESIDERSSLWHDLRAHVPGARELIIDRYLPFAKMLAAKTYGRRTYMELEFDDYFQFASIGLIEAVDRFDVDRGIKFETFATQRITGSILNGIESLSEKQGQVGARQRILSERIESIKAKEIDSRDPAALFGYLAEMAIGLAIGFALEDSGMFQSDEPVYPDNTYDRFELKQLTQRVKSIVATLPDKERRVLSYHYLQRLGFEEIAGIVGVTKGRISQIHKEALNRLRRDMRTEKGIDFSC